MNIEAEIGIRNTYKLAQHHFSYAYPTADIKNEPVKSIGLSEIILTPSERRIILARALAKQAESSEFDNSENRILSQYVVNDLNLLNGPGSNPEHSVLNKLGPTITVTGEIMLANLLMNPIVNIAALEKRQRLIQYFIDNPELSRQLEKWLKQFAAHEDSIISLLDPSDTIHTDLFQWITPKAFLGSKLDTSFSKELVRRFFHVLRFIPILEVPIISTRIILNRVQSVGASASFYGNAITFMSAVAAEAFFLHLTSLAHKSEISYYSYVMERSRRAGQALFKARSLQQALEADPRFKGYKDAMLSYPGIYQLQRSSAVRQILTLLEDAPDSTPNNVWGLYTTNMGRYQRALELLRTYRESLLPIIQATGEIDAWITVAKLVKSGQQRDKNLITFANYIQHSSTPFLRLGQFWNPHLKPDIAVANDIITGASFPANTIITGPNAAGKSTNSNAIAITVQMAQTLGIVPAKYAEITPFSLIHTHMDISAEIATGLSTFKAESLRAIELIKHLEKMAAHQFSLTLMDEIFSSTNPTEGEAGTYGYLKIMGSFPGAINICTSHYPVPTLLAKRYPEKFQNMHVYAGLSNDKIEYDYLLKPGESTQHIAIKILEEEGIQSEFLDIATDIISHPEGYQLSSF